MVLNLKVSAQTAVGLPTCSGYSASLIYYISGGQIYNWDPALPLSATNPWANSISGAPGDGLALGNNIYAATPTTTFYTSGGTGNDYFWYNGTTWVNSGFNPGNGAAVNPTESGNFLYNLVGGSGEIYKNTGTGNGTLWLTVTGFNGGGPYDLQGDCNGNVYILNNTANPSQYLREYSSTGVLINSWTLSGVGYNSVGTAGGGMGIINNMLYFHCNTNPGLWGGVISGTNIVMSSIATGLTPGPEDFASCPLGGVSGSTSTDTNFYCGTGPAITLAATGTPPYTWTVLSGNASISTAGTTGDSVNVTATTTSKIQVAMSNSIGCTSNLDTFLIIVPGVATSIHAGLPDSIFGCGTYLDSLHASFSNNAAWLTYHYNWTPLGSIVSGSTTLTPIVHPTANTWYYLTVTTDTSQGNCTWTDSVRALVVDRTVHATFSDSINFACINDSLQIYNINTNRISNFTWNFGDTTAIDSSNSPAEHVYLHQGIYVVKLNVSNSLCKDSTTVTVNTRHGLHSSFSVPFELLCQGQSITMDNTSTDTTRNNIPPSYYWDFGDGNTDNSFNPTFAYNYKDTGAYNITLIVKDFVPCYDTSTSIVTVMSRPHVYSMDSGFCSPNTTIPIGMEVKDADSYRWSTGALTATIIPDTEGVYTVTETNHCGSEVSTVNVKLYDCDKCLFVPSAFTPNDDGLNDVFHVRQLCPMRYYSIKIYNRYGQMVYTSVYINQGWDGKFNGLPVDIGTYLYEITYTPDMLNAHQLFRKGDVTVVR